MRTFDPSHRVSATELVRIEARALLLRAAEHLRQRVIREAKDIPQDAAFQAYVLLLQKARELGYRQIWRALERWRWR
jgi:hypothetical protein